MRTTARNATGLGAAFAALGLSLGLLLTAAPALAQTAANPLRPTAAPKAQQAAPVAEEAKTTTRSRKKTVADPEPEPAAAPAATEEKSARKVSPGQQAARQRQKQCGEEWRAQKAAGKIAEGQKWPQYWSACNTRLKARGL